MPSKLGGLLAALLVVGAGSRPADPLADEVARWSAFLASHTAKDEIWPDVKAGSQPALERTGQALKDGRRHLALLRLAVAREGPAAAAYMAEHAAAQADLASLEAEWKRMGRELDLAAPTPAALDGVAPAAVRAVAEAALPQVRIDYQASLEYARATQAAAGLYYLGAARAQRELVAFCRSLKGAAEAAPPLRALGPELDVLEGELLAAYRPPASIDRHRDFILASSALKEARELDTLGLRHGALLRYLLAVQRAVPLRADFAPLPPAELRPRLQALTARLAGEPVDHTIGLLFLEAAGADLDAAGAGPAPVASAVVSDVLPRYLAALQPARPAPVRPQPRATVTLIRWPST